MNLHTLYATKNECYIRNAGTKWTPKGIMIHSTGANNPNLKRYVGPDDGLLGQNPNGNYWNQYRPDGQQICCHAFIGKLKDGTVATYQILPWECKGWNNGGSSNSMHIAVEICEDGLTDKTYFNKVYKEAVELSAYLCKKYGISVDNVIDHYEGHKKGIASGHVDVSHWFPKFGKSMDTFRADVTKQLKANEKPKTTETKYKVNSAKLNIRKGPSTKYDIVGKITDKGTYSVTQTKKVGCQTWGKLKSGAGWICLSIEYAVKK